MGLAFFEIIRDGRGWFGSVSWASLHEPKIDGSIPSNLPSSLILLKKKKKNLKKKERNH